MGPLRFSPGSGEKTPKGKKFDRETTDSYLEIHDSGYNIVGGPAETYEERRVKRQASALEVIPANESILLKHKPGSGLVGEPEKGGGASATTAEKAEGEPD